jgi:hypothetical protein
MNAEELPLVGLLFYKRKIKDSDYPKLYSENGYDELRSWDYMLFRNSYETYKEQWEKYNENFCKQINEGTLVSMMSTIPFERDDHQYTKNIIANTEKNLDFLEWYSSSKEIVDYFKSV